MQQGARIEEVVLVACSLRFEQVLGVVFEFDLFHAESNDNSHRSKCLLSIASTLAVSDQALLDLITHHGFHEPANNAHEGHEHKQSTGHEPAHVKADCHTRKKC